MHILVHILNLRPETIRHYVKLIRFVVIDLFFKVTRITAENS